MPSTLRVKLDPNETNLQAARRLETAVNEGDYLRVRGEFFIRTRGGVQPARRKPPVLHEVEDTVRARPLTPSSPPKTKVAPTNRIRAGSKLIPKDPRRVGGDPVIVAELLDDGIRTSKGRTIKASRLNRYEVL